MTPSDKDTNSGPTAQDGKLGTFAGVFTPSVLTILGIILFLRLGYVVGSAGLIRGLAIILLANVISVLTSISLSAVATNLRVKGGGDYYLISRTLGVEYGGALGIVLYLAQSVSVAFYAIGFGEAVAAMAGAEDPRVAQAVAGVAVAGLFVLAWLGADWATRFQFVVMAVLFAALVFFYAGGIPSWNSSVLAANLSPASTVPFWALFAIFFPAVTGFTQGVSMSGDLRDPGRSIPLGTFLAVGLSVVVYLSAALVFAAAVPGDELATDYEAMRRVSLLPWLVDAGVIAATLSSALASFLGAPRILQSLAADRVFPWLSFFSKGHGSANNPRRGAVLSLAIAGATVALGDLNVVAPVVSMFFLISYGLLNYATYFEARAMSPSFRPRFRFFHARASLAGCVVCLGVMLALNPTAGAVAVAVLFALHQYLSRRVAVSRWADSDRSMRFQRVRGDLHAIADDLEHPRYWRPVVLAFSDQAERRGRLLRFAAWLEGGSGFTTTVRIVEGHGARARLLRQEVQTELQAEIVRGGYPAFARAVVAQDPEQAISVVLQSHGLGTVSPNTVLLNWPELEPGGESEAKLRAYGMHLRVGLRFGCNVIALSARPEAMDSLAGSSKERRLIDVWYRDNATGRVTLLLAYLMTRHRDWEDARIRLFAVAPKDVAPDEARTDLERMLQDARIPATPHVVEDHSTKTVARNCADASVVFLPFRLDEEGPRGVNGEPLDELLHVLPVVALVLGAQDIVLDAEPEAGSRGEIAQAVDTAEKARKTAEQSGKEAEAAAERSREAEEALKSAREAVAPTEDLEALEAAARVAATEAESTRRRAARARVKSESAEEEKSRAVGKPDADEPTPPPPDADD